MNAGSPPRGRILLLSPFPYGEHSGQGGATACFNALKSLATRFDIAVLAFHAGSPSDVNALASMEQHAKLVRCVPLRVRKIDVLKAKTLSLVTRTPEHAFYFHHRAFVDESHRIIEAFEPDWVITQFPQMAQYIQRDALIPFIADVQDAFSVSWFRRMAQTRGLSRWYALKQWLNWVHYERRHYAIADETWTLSEQDRWGLTAFEPSLRVRTVGLPMTVSPLRAQPKTSTHKTPSVGFIASFSHPPNVEALHHLLGSIAPLILQAAPEVRIQIAGRNPPAQWVAKAPQNVEFLGYVEDLADFYAAQDVIVAPLLSGGGLKIKVAEAMGFGKAIVASPIAIEGMGLTDGQQVLQACEAKAFADATISLLHDAALRTRLETAALDHFKQVFDQETWLDRVTSALHALKRSDQVLRP